MLLHYLGGIPENGLLVIDFRWPIGMEWVYLLLLGSGLRFSDSFLLQKLMVLIRPESYLFLVMPILSSLFSWACCWEIVFRIVYQLQVSYLSLAVV